jgi:hypothetical protein
MRFLGLRQLDGDRMDEFDGRISVKLAREEFSAALLVSRFYSSPLRYLLLLIQPQDFRARLDLLDPNLHVIVSVLLAPSGSVRRKSSLLGYKRSLD